MRKILIIGATGQIGSELSAKMRELYGRENVVASTVKNAETENLQVEEPFEFFDIRDKKRLAEVCDQYRIDHIINMAALLSATGEKNPMLAWDINVNGFLNVLEVAKEKGIKQVLTPSSIAAFGPETPRVNTPQETVLRPTTMYGVTKVTGELLGNYYVKKFGVDVRGLRYPGIISYKTLPGGGTTDYAVAIYYDAIRYKKYTCFVREDTKLPMMYMPDCLKATVDLFEADFSKLKHHADFNLAGMSFTAGELAAEIKKHIPDFQIEYKPDFRQAIADSWPQSIDDSAAREEWGWKPSYNLATMTEDMLTQLEKKLK
ncbi:MAG: NAD-dependent epimerase/dehydratase family protein [Gammaproteobacteria bacterium]|nr:NAD-dependent epimerase/dehydratase family protein [Gammaproteobacteria bacterium]